MKAFGDNEILFFDGVCNLCNRMVIFLLKHDRRGRLKFASLQSAAGEKALTLSGAQIRKDAETVIFYEDGNFHARSKAALRALAALGGPWRLAKVALVIPGIFRDWLYDGIAKRRYRWFGKKNECMIPLPEHRSRFLEHGVY